MTKDEEQLIANIMHRMHANEQARLDAALSSARADAVTRAEADRVRIDALAEELLQEREAHAETADILNKTSAQLREAVVQKESDLIEAAHKTAKVLQHREGESLLFTARRVVEERDGLLTQVQDMRAEIARLREDRDQLLANLTQAETESRVARETLQTEIERLKSPTSKHPVKVGEWVRRTSFEHSIGTRIGAIAQVIDMDDDGDYEVAINGTKHCWSPKYCTPCDPPTEATHDTTEGRSVAESVIRDDRKTEPKPGDMVRLVRVPTPDPELDGLVTWPWQAEWGKVGEVAEILKTLNASGLPAIAVRLASGLVVWWPLSCVEGVRAELDAIKVGDVVEVFQATAKCTLKTDIGTRGTVLQLDDSCVYTAPLDGFLAPTGNHVALCDVRTVTT